MIMNTQLPGSAQNGRDNEMGAKRAIEVGFPIVEINRLAVPERNSFKPIYQMHKWFARRASCVFRAILLGTLKPAFQPDGTPTDIMAEFYKDHSNDTDTKDKIILDPFMGGGTTVVEALRLRCRVIGIDLNPVAWFIVKTETEPVDLDALKSAFERLALWPVAWNESRPLRETLLGLYKTELAKAIAADVIYTFWVKSAICTDPNCRREVPLFPNYIIAQKSPTIRYHRDAICSACRKTFDWEVQVASLIAEPSLMVNAARGSGGEGRPTALWSYAPEPPKPRKRSDLWQTEVPCPHCQQSVRMRVPSPKKQKKKVALAVLLCPACEAVWHWRGPLPDGEVTCPSCRHIYDPSKGNVPEKGKFQCSCGQKDDIIASIRTLPQDRRLPLRPYAVQAYFGSIKEADNCDGQATFFESEINDSSQLSRRETDDALKAAGILMPDNGKFFKRFSVSDMRQLQQAEAVWGQHKSTLLCPKSAIPLGDKTKSGLLSHHYNYWHEMFAPRQLLALSTLLQGIMMEKDQTLKEMMLCAFSNTVEANNLFVRNRSFRNTPGGTAPGGVFSRHDFQPKSTCCEQNVWGTESGTNTFRARMELLKEGINFRGAWVDDTETVIDPLSADNKVTLDSAVASDAILALESSFKHVVTDPPYVGNVNYAELADFFYVWLRLALSGLL
jgi:putative DNA methylase